WQARAGERVFKGGRAARSPAEKREYIHCCRPAGLSIAEGCRLMGLTRSTFYAEPQVQPIDEARLVEQIKAVCAEWPAYGYRRVTGELHGEGRIVNHKKVMRLMKENGLTVRPRRRFIATTDSDHDGPIFPNLAENVVPTDLALGRRYHLHRHRDRLRLSRCDPGCLVTASCRLCNRQTGRCAFGACRPASRHRRAPAATRVHPSLRSRFAVRGRRLPRGARQARPQGFDGPTWQPI